MKNITIALLLISSLSIISSTLKAKRCAGVCRLNQSYSRYKQASNLSISPQTARTLYQLPNEGSFEGTTILAYGGVYQ